MKKAIKEIIECALDKAKDAGELELAVTPDVVIEKPKDEKLGDFASNIAMTLARSERKNPKSIAQIIVRHIEKENAELDSLEIAGPGFLNLKMSRNFFLDRLADAVEQRNDFGKSNVGQGNKNTDRVCQCEPNRSFAYWSWQGCCCWRCISANTEKSRL